MTTWTDVDDKTTLWNQKGYPVDKVLAESQEDLLLEDSTEIGTEGVGSIWGDIADKDTNWGFFGGLIRICTEGLREDLMVEARADYIIYSHGEDKEIWTDIADISTIYTKINDI